MIANIKTSIGIPHPFHQVFKMTNLMLDFVSYDFIRYAFYAGTLAAILAGIVGYFVILRQLAFAAHALGHVGFAGASAALLLGILPLSGQLFISLLAAIAMGLLSEQLQKSDMAIGIILSFCLGLGTLFLHFYNGYAGQANIILFGNLLAVTQADLYWMLCLMLVCLLQLGIIGKRLLFASIEPELAEAKGIHLTMIAIIFMLIMAVAVTLASQVVGVILVFILLIGPASIAMSWTHQCHTGLILSVLLAIIMVWSAIILAYYSDWPISFWMSAIVFVLYVANRLYFKYAHG
jgi:zinc/manganese transport system permease protein